MPQSLFGAKTSVPATIGFFISTCISMMNVDTSGKRMYHRIAQYWQAIGIEKGLVFFNAPLYFYVKKCIIDRSPSVKGDGMSFELPTHSACTLAHVPIGTWRHHSAC